MNDPIPTHRRAVIYTRVSSDEQTKGYGLEYQLEDCRRAVEQHGHELVDVYSDPGISGTVENRPGLNRLREDAKSARFDAVYFWKSDRLARDEILQLTLYREFKSLGIDTCSVSEPSMNDLMRGIYAVFGAEDLRNLKSKMYSGRIRALKAGKWIGSPPYGYVKDSTFRLVVNEAEAHWVRQLFEWFVNKRLSLKALVKMAYENGVPTRYDNRRQAKPRNGTAFWSQGTMNRLLRREYYATGEATIVVRPRIGEPDNKTDGVATEDIRVSVPPLISSELFQSAQEQLQHNHQYARRRAKRLYLFAKKLRCAVCGTKLTGNCPTATGNRKYYRGDATDRDTRRCESCRYHKERDLDDILWPQILSLFREPARFLESLENYRTKGTQMKDIEAEKEALARLDAASSEQEASLLRLELEGFYSPDALTAKRNELATTRQEIAKRRKLLARRVTTVQQQLTTIASAERLYEVIRDRLEAPTYELKHEVYLQLIEKIHLDRDQAEVWLNVPHDWPMPIGGAPDGIAKVCFAGQVPSAAQSDQALVCAARQASTAMQSGTGGTSPDMAHSMPRRPSSSLLEPTEPMSTWPALAQRHNQGVIVFHVRLQPLLRAVK